jgi:hypothetical protein
LLIVFLTGSQWLVLQGVAWTGMLIQYSIDENIVAGVQKTFDGEHPCAMCKAIDKAASRPVDEQQSGAIQQQSTVRLDGLMFRRDNVDPPSFSLKKAHCSDELQPHEFSLQPPVPPPRFLVS